MNGNTNRRYQWKWGDILVMTDLYQHITHITIVIFASITSSNGKYGQRQRLCQITITLYNTWPSNLYFDNFATMLRCDGCGNLSGTIQSASFHLGREFVKYNCCTSIETPNDVHFNNNLAIVCDINQTKQYLYFRIYSAEGKAHTHKKQETISKGKLGRQVKV